MTRPNSAQLSTAHSQSQGTDGLTPTPSQLEGLGGQDSSGTSTPSGSHLVKRGHLTTSDLSTISYQGSEKRPLDEIVINWDGPNDPDNPRNWKNGRRWVVTLVVSLFTFIRSVTIQLGPTF